MKITLLYPGSYFDIRKPDEDYADEYREALRFPEFQIACYNYDGYTAGDQLKLYPPQQEPGLCIYRGWMLKPERYHCLYDELLSRGIELINTPMQYENCHQFPHSYPLLCNYTPDILVFPQQEAVDWDAVKQRFNRFMIKDYVKSVKGTSFPTFFDSSCPNTDLDRYLDQFKELRGSLFVGGIVIKEYVDLKKRDGLTNEYRAFYWDGQVLTVSANSNQRSCPNVPDTMVRQMPRLGSCFYTIDFAESSQGDWIVIETGDGQVSGLSPGQHVFKFYEELLRHAL